MTTRARAFYLLKNRIKSEVGHPTFIRLFKIRFHSSSLAGNKRVLVDLRVGQAPRLAFERSWIGGGLEWIAHYSLERGGWSRVEKDSGDDHWEGGDWKEKANVFWKNHTFSTEMIGPTHVNWDSKHKVQLIKTINAGKSCKLFVCICSLLRKPPM